MPWVRLDDGFADHPKVEAAGPLAAWLHVSALCYSARHLTDGRVPRSKARRLTDVPNPTKHIETLLTVGLWHEDGDDYVIHDYLDYQPSRSDVEKERESARERMANARRNKGRSSGEQDPNVRANNGRSSRNGSSGNPIPSRPDPVVPPEQPPPQPPDDQVAALVLVPDSVSPSATDADAANFDRHFWPIYPARNGKKIGKGKALTVWRKLNRDDQLAAWRGVQNYAAAVAEGLTIAKDPERWLRRRVWEDWQTPAEADHRRPQAASEPKGFAALRSLGGEQ